MQGVEVEEGAGVRRPDCAWFGCCGLLGRAVGVSGGGDGEEEGQAPVKEVHLALCNARGRCRINCEYSGGTIVVAGILE